LAEEAVRVGQLKKCSRENYLKRRQGYFFADVYPITGLIRYSLSNFPKGPPFDTCLLQNNVNRFFYVTTPFDFLTTFLFLEYSPFPFPLPGFVFLSQREANLCSGECLPDNRPRCLQFYSYDLVPGWFLSLYQVNPVTKTPVPLL
jgi:hypothetical protein